MAFTLTTITVGSNTVGGVTNIGGTTGVGEIVALARASDNTPINPATDDTLQTIVSNQTNGSARVITDSSLVPSKPATATLLAATALPLTIPAGVKQVVLVNTTGVVVTRDYTGAATAGSLPVQPNGGAVIDKGALGGLTLSLYSASGTTINGTSAGIAIEYWS